MSKFPANQEDSAREIYGKYYEQYIYKRESIRRLIEITLKRPRLGFNFPAKTLRAVDFPIPLVPTKPRTCPGLGTGNL